MLNIGYYRRWFSFISSTFLCSVVFVLRFLSIQSTFVCNSVVIYNFLLLMQSMLFLNCTKLYLTSALSFYNIGYHSSRHLSSCWLCWTLSVSASAVLFSSVCFLCDSVVFSLSGVWCSSTFCLFYILVLIYTLFTVICYIRYLRFFIIYENYIIILYISNNMIFLIFLKYFFVRLAILYTCVDRYRKIMYILCIMLTTLDRVVKSFVMN